MVNTTDLPRNFMKEEMMWMIDAGNLPYALKETFEECRNVVMLMKDDINSQLRKPKRMGS